MNTTLTAQTATHANVIDAWNMVTTYEIIRVVSEKTIEIRKAANDMDSKNDKYSKTRIRLNKNGDWKDNHGRKFGLDIEPTRFKEFHQYK